MTQTTFLVIKFMELHDGAYGSLSCPFPTLQEARDFLSETEASGRYEAAVLLEDRGDIWEELEMFGRDQAHLELEGRGRGRKEPVLRHNPFW
jgi:hypothetical protein